MSFYREIKIIEDNPKIFVEKSQNSKQIPGWLMEFDQKINLNKTLPRPSTHNNSINQPKWFEELSQQKRRMSDIGNINLNLNDELGWSLFKSSNTNTNNKSDNELNPKINIENQLNRRSLLIETSNEIKSFINNNDDDNDPYMPLPLGHHHRFNHENKTKLTPNNGMVKLSNGDDGNNGFQFTSKFKSIENLRLDEMIRTIEEECIIPEMPTGIQLQMILLENWGDQYYIGLNGIEILDQYGERPNIKNVLLETDSHNQLKSQDLLKLIDNVYRTHDDAHIWQYKLDDKSLPIRIIFQFDQPTTIALIRIWNHNKSRIHSYKGVRYAKFKLDDQTIFCGEIAKARGDLTGSLENFGDTILFTTDDEVLERISRNDTSFKELLYEQIN